ncbi:MAG: TIGR03000 domain-containing protein [Thermogutta sp.]
MRVRIWVALAVLGLSLGGLARTSDAFWPHCGYGVWYPGPLTALACWTPCWSVCDVCIPCDPSCIEDGWVVGLRPGPIRRLILGPYRWYRVPTVCCDICGQAACACEPAWVTSPTISPNPAQPTPAPVQPSPGPPLPSPSPTPETDMLNQPAPANPLVNPTSYSVPTRNESGLLTVYVPAQAKVFINGMATKSAGTRREYVSYGLKEGLQYRYVITAQVEQDGKLYEETREVILTAGEKKGVAFSFQFPSEAIAGL